MPEDIKEKRFVVAGIGEVLWDLLPSGPRPGGAPANFAYHAAVLGAESHVISAVGDDAPGRKLMNLLGSKGLGVRSLSVLARRPTGSVSVTLDAAGQPRYAIAGEVAWDFLPFTEQTEFLAARLDAICFGTIAQRSETSRESIRRTLLSTKPACLRILDVNLRAGCFDETLIRSSLALASVLKLNDEELPVVSRLLGAPAGEDAALRFLLEQFPLQLIALTKGARGCRLQTPDRDSSCPGETVTRMKSSVGAGDAFAAALVMGLLTRRPLELLTAQANRLAAFVCSKAGGMPTIPQALVKTIAGALTGVGP